MTLKKYNKFLIDSVLESILVTSDDFKKIISKFTDKSRIARILFDIMYHERDVKTSFNFIDQSDKNDEISFLPDNQYQRMIGKNEDPSTKTKSKAKIGRAVRQLLKDNNLGEFPEADIEKFVNQFKAVWDQQANRKIEIVTGEDIITWYNVNNYVSVVGTLGNSCMRFPHKSNFLKIYSTNPDKVSLVVLTDGTDSNKLLARALVWKLDDGRTYLDRIYSIEDSDVNFVYNWALSNISNGDVDKMPSHYKGSDDGVKCSLENIKFEQYPYMDTMYWLFQGVKDGSLTGSGYVGHDYNESKETVDYVVHLLQSTDGTSEPKNYRFSRFYDKWILTKNAIWVRSLGDFVNREDVVRCKYLSEDLLKSKCTWSEKMEDWIPTNRIINHPTYGPIISDLVVSIMTGYNGVESDPLKIWIDIEENGRYDVIEDIKKGGSVETFLPDKTPPTLDVYISRDLMVDDVYGDKQVDFLCYKFYKVADDDMIKGIENLYIRFSNSLFISEVDAIIFGVSIDKSAEHHNFSCLDYVDKFRETPNKLFIDKINRSNASDTLKSNRIELANAVHGYILGLESGISWVRSYKFYNAAYDKFGDKDVLEIFLESFNLLISNMDKDGGKWPIRKRGESAEKYQLSKYIDHCIEKEVPDLSDESAKIIHKYYKVYLLFYSLTSDSYDSAKMLGWFVSTFENRDYDRLSTRASSGYSETLMYALRSINRYGSDYITDLMGSELRNLSIEKKIDIIDRTPFDDWLTSRIYARTQSGIDSGYVKIISSLVS